MNFELPTDPRQALEVSLTALVLGELPPDQAEFLRRTIAQDAELAKMHERLRQTIELVGETEKTPVQQPSASPQPLRLSDGRRQELLQHFKTVAPKQFEQAASRTYRWLLPVAVGVVFLFLMAGMLLPAFSRAKSKSSMVSNGRLAGAWFQHSAESAERARVDTFGERLASETDQRNKPARPGNPAALSDLVPLRRSYDENRSTPLPKVAIVLPSSDDAKKAGDAIVANEKLAGFAMQDQPRVELRASTVNESLLQESVLKKLDTPSLGVENLARKPAIAPVQDTYSAGRMAGGYGGFVTPRGDFPPGVSLKAGPASAPTAGSTTLAFDSLAAVPTVPATAEPAAEAALRNRYGLARGAVPQENVRRSITAGVPLALEDRAKGLPLAEDKAQVAGKAEVAKEKAKDTTLGTSYQKFSSDMQNSAAAAPGLALAGDERRLEMAKPAEFSSKIADGLEQARIPDTRAKADKVPVLGDVPLIGKVFRYEDYDREQTYEKFAVASGVAGSSHTNLAVQTVTVANTNQLFAGLRSVVGFDWGAIATNSGTGGGGMLGGMRGMGGGMMLPRANVAGGGTVESKNLHSVLQTNDSATVNLLLRQFFLSMGLDLTPPKGVFWNDKEKTLSIRATPEETETIRSALQVLDVIPDQQLKAPTPEQPDLSSPKAPPLPVPQPEVQTTENPFSTFSLNVSDVSFKTAAASLEKGVMPEPGGIRSEEFINAFDYRDPEPAPGMAVGFSWDRARYPFAQNRDVLRFAIKTAAQGRQAGQPLNIVLLLDNSGSMERADRVRIIREALKVLSAQLQPQDKLSVVTFARTAQLRVDGVPGNQAGEKLNEVSELTPEGGTNLEEAMNVAYETALKHYLPNGINRVVLLTDGAANLGDVEPGNLKRKVEDHRKQGIALDCFGIGWEGYNDDLLESLTRNGDGRYGFINTPEEAATEFAPQLAGALHVAASDVKVQVEFNPKRVSAWRQIGYAKHQLTKEQFRDNTVDAAEIGAAESGNALYVVEVNPAGDGPLGTVRVRYKVPGTADYHEHEWTVPFNGSAAALEQSSAALKLATTASAFSEWLASSPYAAEVTTDALLRYVSGVPDVYGADPRPKKLEWMIRQAGSLGK